MSLEMFDVALASAGAKIAIATSYDENHPPENIIDGSLDTFWPTTGMYPQEFIISFNGLMGIGTVKVMCSNVHHLAVAKTTKAEPVEFETLFEKDLENLDGQLQMEEFQVEAGATASHLKFTITSGYDHFVSMHRVNVDGTSITS